MSTDEANKAEEEEEDPQKEKQSKYPEWSWDHVRTYVAIRRADNYSQQQIKELAKQDIVMLEKMNGNRSHGSVEKGTLHAAKRIKAVNPKVKILFYLNAMVHYGGYEANHTFKNEWAMKTKGGGGHYKWRNKFLSYDHTNVEFREWWVQRALDMVAHDEIDGVFIDGICKAVVGWLPTRYHDVAYLHTCEALRSKLPEGKILIGNALRAGKNKDSNFRHLSYLDGSYLEGWWQRPGQTIDLMARALQQGKIIMLNGQPHNIGNMQGSLDMRYEYAGQPQFIDFPLGVFLLVVNEYAYFSYHVGVDARPRAMSLFDNTRFEAITRKLGKPMGDFVREGNVFTREFEHVQVRVDISSMNGTVTVKEDETCVDDADIAVKDCGTPANGTEVDDDKGEEL